jgi:uncharacterized membrane protein YdbT with pleckstrin-like domain
MRTSNIIKRSIGDNEQAQVKFTLSNEYIKISLTGAIIKWLFIISVLTSVIFYLLNLSQNNNSNNNQEVYFDLQGSELVSSSQENNYAWVIWLAIAFFALIILPILLFYHLYYLRISNEYVFTNHRILIKRGWISTSTISIHYNRITDVHVTQNIIDKILKIGSISISTAGSEGYEVKLIHISKPYALKKQLFSLKEKYRQMYYRASEQFEY